MATSGAPLKPWQMRQNAGSTSSNSLRVSQTVANGRSLSTEANTDIPTPPLTGAQAAASSPSSPMVPQRPSMYGNSSYSRYGSSGYGGYGGDSSYSRYGSGYSGYGGYGSSYGGYGSSYGGYGSSYGGYGSRYGSTYSRFGSSYGSGGYGGSYGSGYGQGGFGQGVPNGDVRNQANDGYFRSALDAGANQISRLGQMAEGISVFSRLLDANFDAMHGSFASILRFLDVFGEFFYVIRSFAIFRFLQRLFAYMSGRNMPRIADASKRSGTSQGMNIAAKTATSLLSADDLAKFSSSVGSTRNQKLLPLLVVMFGFTVVGIPMFLARVWKKLAAQQKHLKDSEGGESAGLENVWEGDKKFPSDQTDAPFDPSRPSLVRAVHDFNGSAPSELSFRARDVIKVLDKPFPEWWEGEINGRRGLFPQNFVQPFVEGESLKEFVQ
eukprot:TRINITY_DN11975_c0_g1_i1.p1 TRINITY_DN11975_c0_g1~~TRINITY_DN11975_c0_g1_i1.p1  ORF type:complete len:438 (-),score=43.57 TRINITY_DN11975_c0_g1_i1:17-1330(-)